MDAYIGEIRMFAGNFAPENWAMCDGRLIPIYQNTALFSILGTTYGGDGKNTFAVPDLRGRAPMCQGAAPGLTPRTLGVAGGESSVTLASTQIPQHTHIPNGSTTVGSSPDPKNNVWGSGGGRAASTYGTDISQYMSQQALAQAGGGQPHNNMQPYTAVNFIICTSGTYPPRS